MHPVGLETSGIKAGKQLINLITLEKQFQRNRGGRPPKAVAEKKKYRFTVKLCTGEKFDLLAKSRSAGCTPAEYLRQLLKSSTVVQRITPDVAAFRREMAAIANNINQTAKVANAQGYAYAAANNSALTRRIDSLLKSLDL